MQCPACKGGEMLAERTAYGLEVQRCRSCDGRFLPFDEHLRWVESGEAAKAPAADFPVGTPQPMTEPNRKARVCPKCSRLMTRHRVALDLPFMLDRCGTCLGVWFDSGEWAAVERHGLLPKLNHLFNDAHQRRLDTEERRRTHEARCRAIVGDEAYAKLSEIKRWLDAQPKRDVMMAYIEGREV